MFMASNSHNSKTKPVVLVTAGANGIGKVIAQTFLEQDYNVHICDVDQTNIDAFLQQFPQATATRADVSDVTQVRQMFSDIENHYQHLDVLVNNAGIAGPTARVENIDEEEWRRTIDIDLNGPFYCTKYAVPMLKRQGGNIVNIASNAAFFGFPLRSPYAASKWALIGLTKTWAMELGPDNISVNALCPGSVKGERIDNVIRKDALERNVSENEVRDLYTSQSSMRLFVSPQDIANMALFLSTPAGASISGQAIGIDGHTEGLSNNL
jgi:NAD(P)-dependent dehydrogenase (short-subunit alcohol dehydrogenase family)